MNYKKAFHSAAVVTTIAGLAFGALTAFAQTGADVSVNASAQAESKGVVRTTTTVRGGATTSVRAKASDSLALHITQIKARADQEITRRTTALNGLAASINAMKHVSATEKASLSASLQSQLQLMANLKTKIDADTSTSTLRTDVQSITSSYRIFILIIPQGHIIAAADRVLEIARLEADLSAKLDARITAGETAGQDVSALRLKLADMNSETADASAEAQAAITLVSGLTPDGGDQAKMQSNKQALLNARAKIKVASGDLEKMRKDVKDITLVIKGWNSKATAGGSASAGASAVAGPGEHCGGNIRGALACGAGFHCAPAEGSHLPVGDVGGTCVAD